MTKSQDNDFNEDENSDDILDRIVGQFDSKEQQYIDVPEWGRDENTPLRIYVSPMTVNQRNLIYKDKNGIIDMRVMVDAIIAKAEFSSGKKMFSKMHRAKFMNKADDQVVARVARFILDLPSDEELEKN